jgi:hypothetical protein
MTVTLLDAQEQGRVLYIGSGISATVEGFHIAQGNAGQRYERPTGGGIFVAANASPQLLDNQVYSNTATWGPAFMRPIPLPASTGATASLPTQPAAVAASTSTIPAARKRSFKTTSSTAIRPSRAAVSTTRPANNRFWHNTLVGNEATSQGGGLYIAAGEPVYPQQYRHEQQRQRRFGASGASPIFGYNNFFENSPMILPARPFPARRPLC